MKPAATSARSGAPAEMTRRTERKRAGSTVDSASPRNTAGTDGSTVAPKRSIWSARASGRISVDAMTGVPCAINGRTRFPRPYECPKGIAPRLRSPVPISMVDAICRPSASMFAEVNARARGSPVLPEVVLIRQKSPSNGGGSAEIPRQQPVRSRCQRAPSDAANSSRVAAGSETSSGRAIAPRCCNARKIASQRAPRCFPQTPRHALAQSPRASPRGRRPRRALNSPAREKHAGAGPRSRLLRQDPTPRFPARRARGLSFA